MAEAVTRRTTCRLCGSDALTLVLSLEPTALANAFVDAAAMCTAQTLYPLDIYLCERCGHAQLIDVVDPRWLFQRHRTAIAEVPAAVESTDAWADDLIRRLRPRQGALVVGIGSNDGTLLRRFDAAGMRPQGVEPAVDLARSAISGGVPTFPGFFSPGIAQRIEEERGRADVVIAQNVLAHADDLAAVIEGVQQILARDGTFVFDVAYLLDMVEGGLFDAIRHENLGYHAVAPLVRFFHSCDMELVAVQRTNGRLRGFVQRLGGNLRSDATVEALCELEGRAGLATPAVFEDLGRRIAATRNALWSLLEPVQQAGGLIAGLGAPAKSTSLLYQFGLDRHVIALIGDDTPWKQGLSTPGLHIPIMPTDELVRRRPDLLIVLAWEHAEALIAQARSCLGWEGRFVVPLPEPRQV